jgi:peptidyl-prolyl cis-trans isomerase-like 3
LSHNERGILAYANTGPDSNGSQFYIAYKALPELDGKYVVFGKVIGGFLTLDQMERKKVDVDNRPLDEITLKSVTIRSNPIAMKSLSWK